MKAINFSLAAIALGCTLASADIISGIVTETGGGPLANARVQLDPTHFAMTGADGKFTLDNTGAVDVGRMLMQQEPRLNWHPEQKLLSWEGLEGSATLSIRDLSGIFVAGPEGIATPKFSTA